MPKVVSFETKRSVLKCYTHFKRDAINRLMDIFNVRTMNLYSIKFETVYSTTSTIRTHSGSLVDS
ncbi:unnamed protein product [Tenebrio molitor]|nr:unnamed protein product [Tenebrio molitor]